jgi:ArsR family transcriptional regulator
MAAMNSSIVVTIAKALGHPARVTVVRELAAGEKCVCDLVEAAGLGWSTATRWAICLPSCRFSQFAGIAGDR